MRKADQFRFRVKMKNILEIITMVIFLLSITIIAWAFESNKAMEEERKIIEEAKTEKVEISKEEVKKEQKRRKTTWNRDDKENNLLTKIAMAEAEGEGVEGKAMVIRVVLNRVLAKGFPNSIEEVIFEYSKEKDIYQFSPVAPGGRWWTTEPDEECWEALRIIMLEGWDESEGALYFEADCNGKGTWHSKNLEYIKTVNNHNFYK